mgnify:CR=1 FL=1
MNNLVLNNIIRFIGLLLFQVLVLNHVNLFGFINPFVYIIWVFLFPFKKNKFALLILSFLLGLSIDFFSDSGGIHAFSTLFIAYTRLFFVKLYFRKIPSDYPFFKLNSESIGKVFNFVVTLTVIHHLIYFSFASFSFQNISIVLLNTLYSSIFTLILFFLGTSIFKKSK